MTSHNQVQSLGSIEPDSKSERQTWQSYSNVKSFINSFHAGADRLDAKPFAKNFFTEDVEMQYANGPLIKGRDNLEKAFAQSFATLELMKHRFMYLDVVPHGHNLIDDNGNSIDETDDQVSIYHGARIKYIVKGDDEGMAVTVPAFMSGVLAREEEEDGERKLKFRRVEIYLDISQVIKRASEKGIS